MTTGATDDDLHRTGLRGLLNDCLAASLEEDREPRRMHAFLRVPCRRRSSWHTSARMQRHCCSVSWPPSDTEAILAPSSFASGGDWSDIPTPPSPRRRCPWTPSRTEQTRLWATEKEGRVMRTTITIEQHDDGTESATITGPDVIRSIRHIASRARPSTIRSLARGRLPAHGLQRRGRRADGEESQRSERCDLSTSSSPVRYGTLLTRTRTRTRTRTVNSAATKQATRWPPGLRIVRARRRRTRPEDWIVARDW